MWRYKNLPVAYAFQIIWGLIWIALIFLFGYKGNIIIMCVAFRPLLVKKEPIPDGEKPWRMYYLTLLYALITICCLIILFYLIDVFFLTSEFVYGNRPTILLFLLPVFLLVHGIIGLIYLYVNSKYS
jgi:hypothetical protein